MEDMEKFLSGAEVWYGFLRIPSKFKKLFPDVTGELSFNLNGDNIKLNYSPHYRRIFGLTKYYKEFKVKEGTKINIKKTGAGYKFFIY